MTKETFGRYEALHFREHGLFVTSGIWPNFFPPVFDSSSIPCGTSQLLWSNNQFPNSHFPYPDIWYSHCCSPSKKKRLGWVIKFHPKRGLTWCLWSLKNWLPCCGWKCVLTVNVFWGRKVNGSVLYTKLGCWNWLGNLPQPHHIFFTEGT